MIAGRFAIALSAVVVAASASAVTPDLGPDQQYPFVGECGGGSGTAIGPRVMITAKHVPGVTFGIAGQTFTAVERINHPTVDLAIFKFDRDLPGWYPLGSSAPLGTPVVWVGYGGIGDPNNQWHGYDIQYGNHGRHAAANVVTKKWNMFGMGPALVSMLIDNPNAAAVAGDSGGACFANGKLVGVISYAFNETGGRLPNYGFAILNGGVPYHGSGAIDLTAPEIRRWVFKTMWKPIWRKPTPLLDLITPPATPRESLPLPFFYLGALH